MVMVPSVAGDSNVCSPAWLLCRLLLPSFSPLFLPAGCEGKVSVPCCWRWSSRRARGCPRPSLSKWPPPGKEGGIQHPELLAALGWGRLAPGGGPTATDGALL